MIIHKIYDTLYPHIRNSDLPVKSVKFGIWFFWGEVFFLLDPIFEDKNNGWIMVVGTKGK